ncbi:hypothetical protein, partial [Salmonella sp. s58998]|uniref:hypothetical protein n=1 Tax=Salmonella sp. s58998 TaxID=3159712 RepID=UPI00397E9878
MDQTASVRGLQRERPVAEQRLDDQQHRPSRRVFPAAARIGDTEPVGTMHRDNRTQQQRHAQQQGD